MGEEGEDEVERLGTMTETRHEVETRKAYNMMHMGEVGEKGIEDEVDIEQMGPCHQVNFVGINVGDRFASIKYFQTHFYKYRITLTCNCGLEILAP